MDRSERINESVRYEHLGVNIRVLGLIGVGIVILAILIHASVFVMYRSFLKHPPQNIADIQGDLQNFPQPRLQAEPQDDRRQFEAAKRHDLTTYGWVDKSRGVAHIPIDKAMDKMLEQNSGKR